MSISDDLANLSKTYGGSKCQAGQALEDHPDQTDELQAAYASGHSARQIAAVLADHQIQVVASSIKRHRRGECACP